MSKYTRGLDTPERRAACLARIRGTAEIMLRGLDKLAEFPLEEWNAADKRKCRFYLNNLPRLRESARFVEGLG